MNKSIERIKREHALLLESIELTSMPFAVYDNKDRLIAWNQPYERLHALAFSELRAQADRHGLLYADLVRAIAGQTVEPARIEQYVQQQLEEHRNANGAAIDRYFPGVGWFRVTESRTRGGGVASFAIDINENKRREARLEEEIARRNAEQALAAELGSHASQQARVESLRELLGLDEVPARIECFDISHTMGEATVASCVVFDAAGPVRGQYRRYNIAGIEPGDDYAAMRQALERRFRRAVEGDGVVPDVLLIDGGAGQLAQARDVLGELGVAGVCAVGVAKGVARKAGDETLLLPDGREVKPGADSPALQLVQQVRDEAHRFAITGHRGRRQKARTSSRLEDIPGIGPRRRGNLLRHFGGLAGLRAAGIEEIARVEGVNAALAARIYASLHGLDVPSNEPGQARDA